MIISRLIRKKADMNREVQRATQGMAANVLAWTQYHALIDAAKLRVSAQHGHGLFIDLHVRLLRHLGVFFNRLLFTGPELGQDAHAIWLLAEGGAAELFRR